jgi:hypothetical protein
MKQAKSQGGKKSPVGAAETSAAAVKAIKVADAILDEALWLGRTGRNCQTRENDVKKKKKKKKK